MNLHTDRVCDAPLAAQAVRDPGKPTMRDFLLCAALAREAADLRDRLICMRQIAESPTGRPPSLAPGGCGVSDPLARAVASIDALETLWLHKIEAFTDHVRCVEAAIATLDDPDVRTVLRMRFIDGLIWDDISDRTHYVDRWCRTLCKRGLRALGIQGD